MPSPSREIRQSHSHWHAASWLEPVLDPMTRPNLVLRASDRIFSSHELPPFRAIAFTGLSGAIIAGSIADRLQKFLYAVRKKDENRHSSYVVEGPIGAFNYLIVDDFVQSGQTIQRIVSEVFKASDGMSQCVGFYSWRDDEFYIGPVLARCAWKGRDLIDQGAIYGMNPGQSYSVETAAEIAATII